MKYTVKEVLQFIEGNDVRFVRLVFFDISGRRKNLLIMASELKSAFEKGVPIPASAVCVDARDCGELLLVPEPDTLRLQNRQLNQGAAVSLICSIRRCDGKFFEGDVRRLLRQTAEKIHSSGLGVYFSISADFTLIRTDSEGDPTGIPDDRAGYYAIYPDDRGESVIRRICLSLEGADIVPLSCCHAKGKGQHTVELKYTEAMKAADDYQIFRAAAMTCAAESGLYASFEPCPLNDSQENRLKISIALREAGENLFTDRGQGISKRGESFIAGILRYIHETAVFFTKRSCGKKQSMSVGFPGDDSVLHMAMPGSARARLEFLFADTDCNIFPALTLILNAGLEGIEKEYKLPDADDKKEYPELTDMVKAACESDFVRRYIPEEILSYYEGAND